MRYLRKKFLTFIIISCILSVIFIPIIPEVQASDESSIIEGVPYVWQRFDGLSSIASITSILQFYGSDVDFNRVLALSGSGWGMMYGRVDPGWYLRLSILDFQSQIEDIKFLLDVLGYEMTYYSQYGGSPYSGVNGIALSSWNAAWEMLTSSIISKNPVLVSLDPVYLPPEQYDVLRQYNIQGAAQGVVVIGYDQTSVTIIDPGFGIWDSETVNPPDEGEGIYSLSRQDFQNAWQNRYFTAFSFSKVNDEQDVLGAIIRRSYDKISPPNNLTGVYPTYYGSAYGWSLGYHFFEKFAYDMQPSNFRIMVQSWLYYLNGDIESLINVVKTLPPSLVWVLTMMEQLVNHSSVELSKSLESIPDYENSPINEINMAVSYLNNLTDDQILKVPFPLMIQRAKNTTLDKVFNNFISALESENNISSAIQTVESDLWELSDTLDGIADHLKNATKLFPFQLKVVSEYGSPEGSGWYAPGTEATFSVETPFGSIVQQSFTNWKGDSNATTPSATIVMDQHHIVIAEWQNDYTQLLNITRLYVSIAVLALIFFILASFFVGEKKSVHKLE